MNWVYGISLTLYHSIWFCTLLSLIVPAMRWLRLPLHWQIRTSRGTTGIWLISTFASILHFSYTSTAYTPLTATSLLPVASGGLSLRTAYELQPLIVFLWSLGASGRTLYFTWQIFCLQRTIRRSKPSPPEWQIAIEEWTQRLGMDFHPRCHISDDIEVPCAAGIFCPVILIPPKISKHIAVELREFLVAHELFHLKQRDPLYATVDTFLRGLYFFHPAAWWMQKNNRLYRELWCDDQIARLSASPLEYAAALVEIEEVRSSPLYATSSFGLRKRIETLTGKKMEPTSKTRSRIVATITFVIAILFGFAGLRGLRAAHDHPAAPFTAPTSPPPKGIVRDQVLAHWSEIEHAAEQQDVDPLLLAAMVHCESGGNPKIRSVMGAIGLMQLMPLTAKKLGETMGHPIENLSQLEDPALNLKFGSTYISDQLRHYSKNHSQAKALELAVTAYNAGPQRVQEWLDDARPLPQESQRYQAKVLSIYRELQAADLGSLPK